ncbi:MAG: GNAT family N-acetyltransferase [Burkholderiales bacterium]|nr:GNAT family N-acetyltransferase [Burkholderiales bacterium]
MTNQADTAAARLRTHQPGDIGWVISQHGEIYAREYGWDIRFESFVARIAADFVDHFDAAREVCYLAVRGDGTHEERLGCAFVVRQDDAVAKLRMVIVRPEARGLGVGKRLVRACIDFARNAGYTRMTLWTNDVLHAARAIYIAEGFTLVAEERHHSFGLDLVGQHWERAL